MAIYIKAALRGFWQGLADLGRGFDWSYTPPPQPKPEECGLGKYFSAVGGYMWKVIDKHGSPEVKEAARAN